MMLLNWKTIDKLEARVPGADNGYKGENVEFDVRLGRPFSPLRISSDEDDERFRIENKQFDISVEGASLKEAKQRLREKLAASDNFNGTWKLWMYVDAHGGYDERDRFGEEYANCSINVRYVVELTTGSGKMRRVRHVHLVGALPDPFTGEFPVPKTHKELSRLQNGPALGKRDQLNRDEVWVEATPELVATIRELQRRLGESGDKVKEALSRKRFKETIEKIQAQEGRLLTPGAAIIPEHEEPNV